MFHIWDAACTCCWTIPHLPIWARALPSHLHEHSYTSVSVGMTCFHMRMNIHMFVHVMRIAICPLWLVFKKPLREQAVQMAKRMTKQICHWYPRRSPCYSPRHSRECVNVASYVRHNIVMGNLLIFSDNWHIVKLSIISIVDDCYW